MTPLGALITFFPAFVALLGAGCGGWLVLRPGWLPVAAGLTTFYLLPLAAYRLHGWWFPLREGGSRLVGGYSAWYGGHQIQAIYLTLPVLESLLRLVPGLYSAWLRLWGAKVGRGVYWTPQVEIIDRGLLEIGDRVVFGYRSGVVSHVIRPSKGNLLLYVGKVRIGDRAFIGAGSYLGPGVTVAAGAMVPATTHVFPRAKVSA